jgi:predicted MFS family arabinose efflux permease
MWARLSYGLLALPLLLALRDGTGSYAVAGTATGVFGLVGAVFGPARARLVERRAPALMLLAAAYAACLALLAAACAVHVPGPLAVGLAFLAGLFPPPVGPLMRALWGRLAPDEALRRRALSLDTAAESTVFALGPVFGGFLVAVCPAPAVLAGCAGLVLTGFGLFAAALRRVPVAVRAAVSAGAAAGSPLRVAHLRPLLVLVWAVAAAFAVGQIAVVAAWGTVAAGTLSALFSVGGVLGGLLYGRWRWRGALVHRPLVLAAGSAACYGLPALAYAPAAAGVALLLAGACADVLLVTAYQLVEHLVPAGSRTEAGAWINTAYNLGVATGAAGGGVLVDLWGPAMSFTATAGLIGLCTALCAALAPRRRPAARTQPRAAPTPSRGPRQESRHPGEPSRPQH